LTYFEIFCNIRSMFKRLNNLTISNSFFLFGARGTGKSTLVRQKFADKSLLEIDLLDPAQAEEALFGLPELKAKIGYAVKQGQWIFVDEVQKAPKILDIAQSFIDRSGGKFIFSGSSARKLRRGAANLLGGRAFHFRLHPLTSVELASDFDLTRHLKFGGLPQAWKSPDPSDSVLYLRSYVLTYLKEEIAEEQLVRKLEPFSKFLPVAAQMSGYLLNYTKLAKDVGISDQTIKTYFQILEDTLLGFILHPFNRSIRKSIGKTPKFYFFDTGVLRALQRTVDQSFDQNHYLYGLYFEHFLIQEIMRRAEYLDKDYRYSFLRISDDQEIDLIIDRPGQCDVLIEIKSATKIKRMHADVLIDLAEEFPTSELYVLSNDPEPKEFDRVKCLHWKMLDVIFK
jgi:predicted AAA+ superfamily ATPase